MTASVGGVDALVPAALEFRGVVKRFGSAIALDGVDLLVPQGRVTALIGPSGCGKPTLLRLCNGLLVPDGGSVRVEGAPLAADSLLGVRHRMGYVIQDGGLFPHLSAADNVTLLARHLGWSEDRTAARLAALAELVHLDSALLERFPRELSGGQAQRVALMRALMLEPAVLLLDEPMAALDPMIRSRLQDDLKLIFEQLEMTVLLVSHDLAEAAHLADELVLLRDGGIVQKGTASDLMRRPANEFVAAFVRAQRGVSLETP
ncbi:MAG: ATP-binding cassette domain-containing protein [Acidobacteria bacterium]|nr:ATP-binding cassette domain-containing protein [Acidobacteriota bacterium]